MSKDLRKMKQTLQIIQIKQNDIAYPVLYMWESVGKSYQPVAKASGGVWRQPMASFLPKAPHPTVLLQTCPHDTSTRPQL